MRIPIASVCLAAAVLLGGCDSGDSPDDEPVAVNDTVQTRPGEAVTINVLANDRGSNLTIESFQERTSNGGRVSKTADDRLLYRPGASFLGTEFFTYIAVNDDGVTSKSGTVTVTVQ